MTNRRMVCVYCGERLELNGALMVPFEDRLEHFDVGIQRYSKLCKSSPTRRHDDREVSA